jgi:hypothetical protein
MRASDDLLAYARSGCPWVAARSRKSTLWAAALALAGARDAQPPPAPCHPNTQQLPQIPIACQARAPLAHAPPPAARTPGREGWRARTRRESGAHARVRKAWRERFHAVPRSWWCTNCAPREAFGRGSQPEP